MTAKSAKPRSRKPKSESRMNLDFVRDFLQTLSDNLQPTLPDTPPGFPSIYRPGEGAIFLTDDEKRQFQITLQKLVAKLASDEYLSESTISNALQNAIFESLDIRARRSDDFASRLDKAILKLSQLASLPAEAHECLIEVSGLDPESLPAKFGSVKFVNFNRHQSRRLEQKALSDSQDDLARRQFVRDHAKRMLGYCFGVIAVDARDAKAALALAERRVRSTVDALNFFTDMMPYNHGWVFLPGDRERRATTSATIKPDGSCHFNMARTKPLGQFSIEKLRRTKSALPLVKSVSKLLRKDRNETEELLLTAVQTAGRATVATRPEESFLLFAIALESIVLPQQRPELTHRLSLRVARLLAKDRSSRTRHSKKIKDLYGIRSRIVHSGSYEIDINELNSIRIYTKEIIAEMLSNTKARGCRTKRELNDWLEQLELQ